MNCGLILEIRSLSLAGGQPEQSGGLSRLSGGACAQ
jgi:hypothetical protein